MSWSLTLVSCKCLDDSKIHSLTIHSAVNATARDFYGFTSAMSYARLILSASSKEELPTGLTKALPPKFAATPLIQHYLNNIFTLLPLFEEASFYRSLDAVYHLDDIATPLDHWSVRMVLAIACLAQSEQRGDTLYSDAIGHVNAALEHAEAVLHPGRISSIQALLLLVEYAMMDPHHFDSWTLIGAASRLVVDLGIHQDPSRSTPISKSKLEVRRRVYWCVYALDRYVFSRSYTAFSNLVQIHFTRPDPRILLLRRVCTRCFSLPHYADLPKAFLSPELRVPAIVRYRSRFVQNS